MTEPQKPSCYQMFSAYSKGFMLYLFIGSPAKGFDVPLLKTFIIYSS